jgi:transposase-like protein
MARTRLNPRRTKQRQTYTVEEVARLYAVHRNTVRSWIKVGGLTPLDGKRPILVMGATLRGFLEVRRAKAKRPCPPGHLYCFGCCAPRAPALGMADFVPQPKGAGKLTAVCATCGTLMHRRARQEALALILPDVPVRIVGAAPRFSRDHFLLR